MVDFNKALKAYQDRQAELRRKEELIFKDLADGKITQEQAIDLVRKAKQEAKG